MPERLFHVRSGTVLAREVAWAKRWPARARGLIGRELAAGEALVLEPGSQVHTLFMTRPIDVVFCDGSWTVLHVISPLVPWRASRWVRRSHFVVELAAGQAAGVASGDQIVVQGSSDR